MKIIDQSHEIISYPKDVLELIELCGRTCYKSEPKGKPERFIQKIVDLGHESVIEHGVMSVRFITNRGVTHELVRHRLASYSQESTRYVRYDGNMEFIKPVWYDGWDIRNKEIWDKAMFDSETAYIRLLNSGCAPEQAREVLPNSLKTEIVMTCNFRQWREVFRQRCSNKAHPQMRGLMRGLHCECVELWPCLFGDIVFVAE